MGQTSTRDVLMQYAEKDITLFRYPFCHEKTSKTKLFLKIPGFYSSKNVNVKNYQTKGAVPGERVLGRQDNKIFCTGLVKSSEIAESKTSESLK